MKNTYPRKGALIAMFIAIAILGLGLFSTSTASADGPGIGVSSTEINLENEGKVNLWGDNFADPGLGAWTVDIYYNADLVSVVECGAEHGGICNPEFKGNAARVTGSAAEGLTGEFGLGSLTFSCKAEGKSNLEIEVKVLADGTIGDPQPVDAKITNGSITCAKEQPKGILGDVDCNGEVNAVDANWVLQYSAGMVDAVPCPDLADMNGDGHIDAVDSTIILQKVAGLIE